MKGHPEVLYGEKECLLGEGVIFFTGSLFCGSTQAKKSFSLSGKEGPLRTLHNEQIAGHRLPSKGLGSQI